MLKPKMENLLNTQMLDEFYSSYLYLSMAAFSHHIGLNGFAHWFQVQSKEEWGHAMKIYDYMIQRGNRVHLKELASPPPEFKSALDIMQKTLEHEKKVTEKINKLYEAARQEKDNATQVMLQWFISEQVEEEAQVSEIIQKLKRIPEKSSAILYLDKELKKRESK